jgi:hypothetical protein
MFLRKNQNPTEKYPNSKVNLLNEELGHGVGGAKDHSEDTLAMR